MIFPLILACKFSSATFFSVFLKIKFNESSIDLWESSIGKFIRLIPRFLHNFSESVIEWSDEYLEGKFTVTIFFEPIALAAIAVTTAESIPPERLTRHLLNLFLRR